MKKVFLFITDAGGGHRGSAVSLKAAAEAAGMPWDIRIVNVYKEVWQNIEPMKLFLGFYAEDLYNFVLKNSLSEWTPLMRKAAHFSAAQPNRTARSVLTDFLKKEKPDLCVSLMPFINDLFTDCHRDAGIPFGLVCTDLMDTAPYMWYTPGVCREAAFVTTPTPEALVQAEEMGVGARIVNSGLLIHPKYFDPALRALPKETAAGHFGLDPGLFTLVILMGGFGGKSIAEFVKHLDKATVPLQVVACCGKNEVLREKLDALAPSLNYKLLPLGFSQEIPTLMRAADLLLTKPGPASIYEALAMNAPMLLDEVDVMPQEKPNAHWVESLGMGMGLKDRGQVLQAVESFVKFPALGQSIRAAQRAQAQADAAAPLLQAMGRCLTESGLKKEFVLN